MQSLSALKIFLVIGSILFQISTALASDVWSIDTGDSESASWAFVLELDRLHAARFPDREIKLEPQYISSYEDRFKNLEDRKSRFVIAPLNYWITTGNPKRMVRILLPLWEVYLSAVSTEEDQFPVSFSSHSYWYVLKKSLIIPAVFDTGNYKNTPDIFRITRDEIPDILNYLGNGVLFLETTGSVDLTPRRLGESIRVHSLTRNFRNLLKEQIPWLETIDKSRGNRTPPLATVGFTMGLFVHAAEDANLAKQIKDLLLDPPKPRFFPLPYIIENLSNANGVAIPPEFQYRPNQLIIP